jgi:tetratricopeptide (TPR) repeat protein
LSKDIRRNQHDASRYFKRGKVYYELGHFDASHYPAALADFNESHLIEPHNETVHVYRGLTLIKLQQYDSAIDAFSRAISLKPDYLSAYKYRGIAYYEKGDYIKAKDDFDRMPSFSGTGRTIHFYRIMVELKLGGI